MAAFENAANTIVGTVKNITVLLVAVLGTLLGLGTILLGAGFTLPLIGGVATTTFGESIIAAFAIWVTTLLALAFASVLPDKVI